MKQEIIPIDLGGVNSYLLKADSKFILIDTGGYLLMDKKPTSRCDILEAALEKAGCTPENLHLILLTHGDIDHVFNAAYIKSKYHAQIAIHKDDAYLVERLTPEDFMNSFNYRSLLFKLIAKIMHRTFYKAAVKTVADFEAFTPDILIDDGFKLSDYSFEGEVIHIPGHTKGSVGILTKDDDLIAGDVFTNTKKPGFAPNALDFERLDRSILKLKSLNIKTVYVGHGKPFIYSIFSDSSYT